MSKKNASAIESGAGYFQGLITAMMDIARNNKVPFEAVYRLAKPEGRATLAKMIGVANADYELVRTSSDDKSDDKFLPRNKMNSMHAPLPASEDERIFVDYKMSRDINVLKKEFTGHSTFIEDFKGKSSWFTYDDHSYDELKYNPTSLDFLLKHFNALIGSGSAIKEMAKKGYRPATHLEAYAYAKKNPDKQLQHWIIALGSYMMLGGGRSAAEFASYGDERVLRTILIHEPFPEHYRFLFVRK